MKQTFQRKLIATLIVPALGLSVAGHALAADRADRAESSDTMSRSAATSSQDVRASKLIGMKVMNAQGERLGKINDLIVDVNNERIYYAVLASGGLAGMGTKLFAYPVSLFGAGQDKDELVLNVDKERLKNAPGFEDKKWPEWGDNDRYRSDVDRYFGPTVTAKAMPNERLVRASKLIGKDINDREGHNAGEIKDLVVNMGSSKVHYAVLDLDKAWSADDKLLPMSLRSLSFPADRDKDVVLKLTKNQVQANQGIDEKRWKDMDINDPTFKRNVESYLHASTPPAGVAGRKADVSGNDSRDR